MNRTSLQPEMLQTDPAGLQTHHPHPMNWVAGARGTGAPPSAAEGLGVLNSESSFLDDEDYYPYYSEEPVTESDEHRKAISYLELSLQKYFEDQPDIYVSSNLFVYYQRGDREERKVSPDVFVSFGARKRNRKSFLTWKEHAIPTVVFEVTSESSRLSDQGDKRAKYTAMGTEEYYLFDPYGEWIPGQFRAYRREGDELVPVVSGSRFRSPRLGLEMEVEGPLLRLYDPRTGIRFLTPDEQDKALRRERERVEAAQAEAEKARTEAEAERARRVAAEEELRRLREQPPD
ncbi:MAG: Uma2 family endonuclease [Armatimonadetes bacterium]|nr:Uma2 family endonuclease [Armatimonadota bacterium]